MPFSLTKLPYRSNIRELAFHFQDQELVILGSTSQTTEDGRWTILSATPCESAALFSSELKRVQVFKQETKTLADKLAQPNENHGELPFLGGVIGLCAYDLGILDESISHTNYTKDSSPIAISRLYPWCFLWDHQTQTCYLAHHAHVSSLSKETLINTFDNTSNPTNSFFKADNFKANWSEKDYEKAFTKTKQYILEGDVYQINLAQKYAAKYEGNPLSAYMNLCKHSGTPFSCYWETDQWQLISASPERFISVKDRFAETKPIKGTRANIQNPETPIELKNSTKDRAENLMIVDLLRNDISKHCSNVRVPKLFDVESFPTVHHLVSTITGQLRDESQPLDLFWDAFPGGSITGAPKKRAMEIITELEQTGRKAYCGSVFYQSCHKHFDSNILIRSFLFENGIVESWAGGGIVHDSNCDDEYQECADKIEKLMTWLN